MNTNESEIFKLEELVRLSDASPEPDTSSMIDQFLADDVILVGPKGEQFTKAFVMEAHRPPKKQPFTSVTVSEGQFKDLGNTCIVCCRGDFQLKDNSFGLRFVRVWEKIKNEWKVVAGTVTHIS